jgi:peptidoglycan/LPS O-acetylase OafA/YrhL
MNAEKADKLSNVEAGRGIAATLVVLYHTTIYYFSTPKYWTGTALNGLFAFGHSGVEFFFVLSGFIMIWIHRSDIGKPSRVGNFAWKRFQRIYPFFWFVFAVTIALLWLLPSSGQAIDRRPSIMLQSFLLAGWDPMHAVVFVSWTLWHEILFYAFCALVIAVPRIGIPAFVTWILVCAIMIFTPWRAPWPYYLTHHINVLFGVGVVLGLYMRDRRLPMPGLVCALGVAIFMSAGLLTDYSQALPLWALRDMFGLGAALGLAGAIELERLKRLVAPNWACVLGAASYSIYLTHMLTLTLFAKVASLLHLPSLLPPVLGFIALAGCAIGAGVVVHYLLERPILNAAAALRRRWPRRFTTKAASA